MERLMVDFINHELRGSIDLLLLKIEWGMLEEAQKLAEEIKPMLPSPYEGYTPFYELK